MYVLYDEFSDKISYESFKKVYHGITYKNLSTQTEEYPYNQEFSNQFSVKGLEYDEIISLRKRYASGEYWRDVYKEYSNIYTNEWSFWNVYNGNSYKLVMPEVFSEENKKKHSGLAKSGTNNGRAKLTESDVILIRKMWKEGKTRQEIYELFPQVTQTSIRSVINN